MALKTQQLAIIQKHNNLYIYLSIYIYKVMT